MITTENDGNKTTGQQKEPTVADSAPANTPNIPGMLMSKFQ